MVESASMSPIVEVAKDRPISGEKEEEETERRENEESRDLR